MAKNVIGIDISDFSIEALSLEKRKNNFKVESYSRFRLSPEIVDDGRILNPSKLKEAILKMFQNARPVPFGQSRKVFLSVPESKTFSQVISLPKHIKDKDINRVAINKAEESIPEITDNLTAITNILSDTENNRQVFYCAAETEVLKSFVSLFGELNIEVVGITTEAISSFAGLKKNKDKKVILLLDLGARTTIASVFAKDCMCSSININIGGDNITRAIAKKLNISYSQAEEKKVQIGLNSDGDGETMLISQGQLQPLVDELKIFIQYWQESNNQNIEQVVLIGGLAQMKGLDKYFGDNLSLPTQLGQAFIDIKDLPPSLASSKYINALGLARIAHQGTKIDFYKKLSKEIKNKDDNKSSQDDNKNSNKVSKFSKKTIIYIAVAIFLLLLATGVLIFRDKLTALIYKDNTPAVNVAKISVENTNNNVSKEVSGPLKIEDKILVSTNAADNSIDVIKGQYYNIDFETSFIPPKDSDYTRAMELLEAQAGQDVVSLLNNTYKQDGYYIIPYVFHYELIQSSVSEESYVVGTSIEATVQYKFIMFKRQDIKDWLISKYSYLKDNIDSIDYAIINYNTDANGDYFNIGVLVNQEL